MNGILRFLKETLRWGDAQANEAADAISKIDPDAALKLQIANDKEAIVKAQTDLAEFQTHVDSLHDAIDATTNEETTLIANIEKRTRRLQELEAVQKQSSPEYAEISTGRRIKATQLKAVQEKLVTLRASSDRYEKLVEEQMARIQEAGVDIKLDETEAGNLKFEYDMTKLEENLTAKYNGGSVLGDGTQRDAIKKQIVDRNRAARHRVENGKNLTKVDEFDRQHAAEEKLSKGDELLASIDARVRAAGTSTASAATK